jgi:heme-degrading monooxygenase HmoA
MYARIITAQLKQDRVEEAVAAWRERVDPLIRQQQGYVEHHLYADRASGRSVVVIHYRAAADLEAAERGFGERMASIAALLEGRPTAARYEVAI